MSKQKTVFSGIRAITKKVLAREDIDAEFKSTVKAIEQDVLVSFANSERGGWILAGVSDNGEIIGCETGDREIQLLQSRASSCHPSIHIEIFIENIKSKPILTIRVPPSEL